MANESNVFFGARNKSVNRGAYQGEMHCPYCSIHADPRTSRIGFETEKTKIKCTGNIGPFVREYKCMKCNGSWRYDITKNYDPNPYSSFKRGLKLPGLGYTGKVPIIK